MESIYQQLAHSAHGDHLQRSLAIAEESQLLLADLLLYRDDGTVSLSMKQEQVGRDLRSIDTAVRLDGEGRPAAGAGMDTEAAPSGEGKRRMGMIRPLLNQGPCHECHAKDKRVLGGLYIMFRAEDW